MAVDHILYSVHCVRVFTTTVENLSAAPGCCYGRLLLVSTSLKSRPSSLTFSHRDPTQQTEFAEDIDNSP